jgi:pimeloyl-ACP methyl ester carboxylesterase
MATDPVGATWGPGVVRAPMRSYWGWNKKAAAAIKTPTLFITGDSDRQMASNQLLYGHLASRNKLFVTVKDASHFMLWEHQRDTLRQAAREWLVSNTFHGRDAGQYVATTPADFGAAAVG